MNLHYKAGLLNIIEELSEWLIEIWNRYSLEFIELMKDRYGNMVNDYGFYIPGKQYVFIHWSDLYIYFAFIILIFFLIKFRYVLNKEEEYGPDSVHNEVTEKLDEPEIENENINFNNQSNLNSDEDISTECQTREKIKIAIDNNFFIAFHYVDFWGGHTKRFVLPIKFYKIYNTYYLKGYCFLRLDERTFNINRISDLIVIDHDDEKNFDFFKFWRRVIKVVY